MTHPRQRKEIQRQAKSSGETPEAYHVGLNKNFTFKEGFPRIVLRATDLYIVIALLAVAKKRKTRRLVFPSMYVALKAIGLTPSKASYKALDHTLVFFEEHGMKFVAFYTSPYRKLGTIVNKLAKKRARKKLREKCYAPQTFKRVWHVWSSGKVEGKFFIWFEEDFWEANEKSYFCQVDLVVLKKLVEDGHVSLLCLYLLLVSFNFKLGKAGWRAKKIAKHIGLKERQPTRLIEMLQRMVELIAEATDKPLAFEISENGLVVIRKPKKGRIIEPFKPRTRRETF